jgi:hypothetical protein
MLKKMAGGRNGVAVDYDREDWCADGGSREILFEAFAVASEITFRSRLFVNQENSATATAGPQPRFDFTLSLGPL